MNRLPTATFGAALAALAALALGSAVPTASAAADDSASPAAAGTFAGLFEPSGVAQLPDGTLLVVEDEAERALHRVRIDAGRARPRVLQETVLVPGGGWLASFAIGPLDDLEGAASDGAGRVFAIGSHGEGDGPGRGNRHKLLRFSVRGDEAVDVTLTRELQRDLSLAHPAIAAAIDDEGALNIEALAFDRRRGALLIGLRAPRLDDRAVVVRLLNPDAYVEGAAGPDFAAAPWALDLDRGGLRAMAYDERSDRLLVVSRRDSGSGRFKLWHLPADGRGRPSRVRMPDEKARFDDVEGVVVLDRGPNAGRGALFVRDDGRRDKGRGAGWFVLSRASLDLDRLP